MTLKVIIIVLMGTNLWTVFRINRLYKVVWALIQFEAGLVENMKTEKQFSRQSEEYALEGIYSVWKMFKRLPGSTERTT
jgi:hypothetical protein